VRRMRYVIRTRPAEAVVPRLKSGEPSILICPTCLGEVVTPTKFNFVTGMEQRLVLVPHRHARCPHGCGTLHWITPAISRPHNRHLYPDDPQVWNQTADWPEEN
jgi:hypothetical protein